MGTLFQGALNATKLVGLKNNERVLIIAEQANLSVGRVIEKACLAKTRKIDFFVMEELGSRPLKAVPKKVLESMHSAKVVFFLPDHVRRGRFNERFTFRMPLTEVAVKNRARFAAMIGLDENCLKQGMCADYKKISVLSRKLFKIVSRAKTISVMSDAGTFLQAEFSRKLKWIVSDGWIKPGKWSNLPDGEVFTAPQNVNGVAVINGSLGDIFSKKYGSLSRTPLYWFIENSRIKKVLCPKNRLLEKEFQKFLEFDKNSSKIGEFALGTNFEVAKVVGNLLQDEKIPGVHMACGNPYPALTGARWSSKVHCDGVMPKTTVFVDGKKVMERGKFVF